MKKIILAVITLSLFFIVGCQNSGNTGKLDISNLKVKQTINNEHGDVSIVEYEAPSVKDGLEALPFKLKLPTQLPIEEMRFLPPKVTDMHNDDNVVFVQFDTELLEKNNYTFIKIKALYPYKGKGFYPEHAAYKEVELNNGIVGRIYNSSNVFFEVNDVIYSVDYLDQNNSAEKVRNEVINLANQMF